MGELYEVSRRTNENIQYYGKGYKILCERVSHILWMG